MNSMKTQPHFVPRSSKIDATGLIRVRSSPFPAGLPIGTLPWTTIKLIQCVSRPEFVAHNSRGPAVWDNVSRCLNMSMTLILGIRSEFVIGG